MRVYTASFYQVRYFSPEVVGLSTAIYDPKWFHDFKDQSHFFKNSKDVLIGLRAHPFVFPKERFDSIPKEKQCSKDCPHDKSDCAFMKAYRSYLEEVGFDRLYGYLQQIADFLKVEDIVLLVHESPSCPCAERPVIQKFFSNHNVEVKEWRKDK